MPRRSKGEKGEIYVASILKAMGCDIISFNKTYAWDVKFKDPNGIISTAEIKEEPKYKKYGGFSVELAHKKVSYISSYWLRDDDFRWDDGTVCVPTGFTTSEADYQVFTNGKSAVYWVKTPKLAEWLNNIFQNEKHRIRWGGKMSHTLQVQIRIDEIKKIGKYYEKKRGRKPSS